MARDQVDLTPIERRDDLVDWIAQGVKPKSQFHIGTEHEKFAFTLEGHRPVPYEGRARHPRAARGHAASARLAADHGGAEHHRPVRRHRRRRDLARAGRPVRAVGRAGQNRAPDVERTDGASGAGAGNRAAVAYRFSRHGHDTELDAGANAANAEGPLQDHDRIHAEGRHARARYDVPHLHGADQSRLLFRSRHGQEAARIDRAAAGRDGAVCQFAIHRGQAERLLVIPFGNLARHRQCARRHVALGVRAGHGFRALGRLRARRADVFRQAWRRLYRRFGPIVPRSVSPESCPPCPAYAPRSRIGRNHISTIFPEVRLKRYLEMRGADSGSLPNLLALPALWVGILYDDAALDAAWDLVKAWSAEDRQSLRDAVPKLGLAATVAGRTVFEVAAECSNCARRA